MLDKTDQKLIKLLARGLPLTSRPYAALGAEVGLEEEEVLRRLEAMEKNGCMRRVGAVLDHHQAGYNVNVMVVWQVEETELNLAGSYLAAQPEITHCYSRVSAEEWPFNLYAMIHARSEEECEEILTRISRHMIYKQRKMLYTQREIKKIAMKYFSHL